MAWLILFLQLVEPALNVNGSPLPTMRPVTRIGNEWFLPIVPIARALGVRMELTAGPVLHAHRLDGTEMTYDGRTGEIRYRFLLIAHVRQFQQIEMDRLSDELLFPLSGTVALLGLDIREDVEHNTLVLQTITDSGIQTHARGGSFFHLGALDYGYGLNTNGNTYGQFANLNGEFIAGGIRTKASMLLSRIPQRSFLAVTQGSVRADITRRQAVILGDQAAYSGIEALANNVRGIGYENTFKGFGSYTYLGRAMGATVADLQSPGLTRTDSILAGTNLVRALKRGEWSIGAIHFDGPNRHGTNVGTAYRETRGKNQFLVQGVAGRGNGLIVADTFSPAQQFAVSGRLERYSKSFLTARQDSHFDPQLTRSASMMLRPIRLITFNGGITVRTSPLAPQIARNYTYGSSAIVPGPLPLQFGFFRSIQTDSASMLGRFTLDQYLVTLPDFRRFSFYSHYSRSVFPEEIVRNLNTTVGLDLEQHGRLGIHDQIQFRKMRRYGVDWILRRGSSGGFVRVGLDRVHGITRESGFSPVASLRVPMRGQNLEITYVGESNAHMLQFQFSGSTRRGREVVHDARGQASLAVSTSLLGRVYLDTDLDGSFVPAVDRPIAEVPVWLDDHQARTNSDGQFRFDGIAPGARIVRAELAGVPADLVFVEIPERTVAVVPYRENILFFRVARAGRVSGVVTYMDYSSDPKNPIERPLPDARIVAGGERDTFSEANGSFLLGDVTPGSYELKLDPATLPADYASEPGSVVVRVQPGEHVQDVRFRMIIPPRPVIEKRLPEN